MIKLRNTDLESLGLHVSKVSGLWDFPPLKQTGTDWSDADYTEVSTRLIDYQYEARTITLDCFVYGNTWGDVNTKLSNLRAELTDALGYGLRMLLMPAYTLRGHLVQLAKTTVFEPYRYFENRQCVAKFKIVFIEPQPFNVQWTYLFETSGQQALSIVVRKAGTSQSYFASSQRFVTVHLPGSSQSINLEAGVFEWANTISVTAGEPLPIVITGNIDSIQTIEITSNIEPIGLDAAQYFVRDGSITFIPTP
jgi:hypothetical protein